MTPRALIVAAGLRGVPGHNLGYTRLVEDALRRRGFEVVVFANKNLAPQLVREFGYHPVFSLGTYDLAPGNGPWADLAYIYAQAFIYSQDLARALGGAGSFDLTFCHTVNDMEIIGLDRCVKRLQIGGNLLILERVTPGFATCPTWKPRLHPYWRIKPHYLGRMRRRLGSRFHLLTDSERLTEDYALVYPHPITTVPIPLRSLPDIGTASVNRQVLRIGYLGDAREAKGFPLLPEVIRHARGVGRRDISFVIHCPDTEYRGLRDHQGLDEMAALAASDPAVRLVRESLTDDRYLELMESMDLVLLPYTDKHFREGTSNVFAEAVAMGKVVVVPEDTWMSDELQCFDGGVSFRRGDVKDLSARLLDAIDRYPELAPKSVAYAGKWRRRHNPDALAEVLLAECQFRMVGE